MTMSESSQIVVKDDRITLDVNEELVSTLRGEKTKLCQVTMEYEKGSTLFQYIAAIAGNLCIVAGGAMIAWTSPVLLILKGNVDNPLGTAITDDEGSWIGALPAVGTLIGSFLAGYLAERFGRRTTLLSSVVPFTLGWILIATGTNVDMIYAARFIFGIALAVPFTVLPMYCGEIAETSIRGILGSFLQLFITVGLLYAYCIGPYVSYTEFWIACGILPLVFFGVFFFMPESPYYLSAKGRHEDVINSLSRLRGKSASAVQAEANEIHASVEESYKHEATIMDLIKVKANLKALLITCALVSFQQLTGINAVLVYAQSIFNSAGGSGESKGGFGPAEETIIVCLVQLIASGITPLIVDRLGRKILLIVSGVGTCLSLLTLGLYFLLTEYLHVDSSNISWLPVASLVIYIALYSIGWGPLPWTVMGEMFASEVKSKASGITVCVCWTLAFLIIKYFGTIGDSFGTYTAFWIFAVCCGISVVFTIFIVPETKGKTLQEIQDELGGKM